MHFFLDKWYKIWYNTQYRDIGLKDFLCQCPTREAEPPPRNGTTPSLNKLRSGLAAIQLVGVWKPRAEFVKGTEKTSTTKTATPKTTAKRTLA
jgi:hypothetical protein